MSTSAEYEAGYIHGATFNRLTIAIESLHQAMAYMEDADVDKLRPALTSMVESRDRLIRPREIEEAGDK